MKQLRDQIKKEDFVVQELLRNKEDYDTVFNRLYHYLEQGFEIAEVRECMIGFRCTETSEKLYMEIRHLVTNMILWRPLIQFKGVEYFDESYIFDCRGLTNRKIKNFIDEKILIPFKDNISIRKANKVISELIYRLSSIGSDFGAIMSMSLTVSTFLDLADRVPRFNEIMKTHIDESLQPSEVEEVISRLKKEMVDIILNDDEYNMLRPLIASGGGIKIDQLSEFAISGGLKPDLNGNTIPITINSNFIYGGFNNLIYYYLDSLAGRKSVIMNFSVMGKSGHFARLSNMLSLTVTLADDLFDCGSVHPVARFIKDKEVLSRLTGRYYLETLNTEYKFLTLEDTHLIGKTIYVRSPTTCASKNGICEMCYGDMYKYNKNINVGGYAATKMTRKVSQDVLSAKHILQTFSEKITFSDDFDKYFQLYGDEIIIDIKPDVDITNLRLSLPKGWNIPNEDYSNDFEVFTTNVIYIDNVLTKERTEIRELNNIDLIMSDNLVQALSHTTKKDKDKNSCPLSDLQDEEKMFSIEINNNELTKPLYSIMSLLNKKGHEGCTTISEMCDKLLDLMITSEIDLKSIHAEVIIRPLIRSIDNDLEFPDFSKHGAKSRYQFLTMLNALIHNNSVSVSLSTQNLQRQISSSKTYKKNGTSYLDALYK